MRQVGFLACFVCLVACGGGAQGGPETPEALVQPVASLEEPSPAPHPSLIGDDGVLRGYPDGPATLLGLRTRCVGEVTGGHLHGCELERVRVLIPGDAIATLLPAQSDEAPALAVDAPLRGGFAGHPLHFMLESPPGDALCPGAPTVIRFFENGTTLGSVTLPDPITRQLGRGVVALLVTPGEAFVLLGWGRDSWRLVDVHGQTISEARSAHDAECDCCD